MNNWQLNTPLLFLIFNRLDTTKQVFNEIRKAKPPRLYLASDGARADKPGEAENVEKVRQLVLDHVDWDCEVKTLFRNENLGCRFAVSGAIDWFFNNEEKGIILEDDCLPHSSFFLFCEILLERYRHDKRVMMISGTNHLVRWKSDKQSYHFANYGGIWGWATWRRAWDLYDLDMGTWKEHEIKKKIQQVLCFDKHYRKYLDVFDAVYQNKIDTWDYQWLFSRLLQSGLSVVPSVNLVSNIGFGPLGTHTKNPFDKNANLQAETLDFPLKPPVGVVVDRTYDQEYFMKETKRNILTKISQKISQVLK